MNKIKYIVLSIGVILMQVALQAQVDQVIVSVGTLGLEVDKAFKLGALPTTIDSVYQSRELEYQLVPRQVEVQYEPKAIKPAKLKVVEPLSKLYRGYIKGGIGLFATPLAELRFNSIRNRDWAYGVKLRHFSSQGGLKDVADNAYGQNHFGGWARHYVNKHTIEGGLSYDLNRIHYYGFNPGDVDIDREDYQQTYKTLRGHVQFASHYKDSSQVQHRGYVKLRNTKAVLDLSETQVRIGGEAAKTIDDYRFGLSAELDVNSLATGSLIPFTITERQESEAIKLGEQKGTIFRLGPSIHARKGDLTADVGIGFAIDTGEDQTKWHFYPQAYLSYSLFDDLFTPYAGITGDLQRNTFGSFAEENPYIHNSLALINTSKDLEIYGGIRGTIFDNLGFNARVSVEDYDDFAFFINDTLFSEENKFGVIYDDLRVLRLAGELTYKHDDRLTLAGRLEIRSNTANKLSRAFNLPGVRFTFDGRYDLDDKFVVKAQIFANGRRYGATMRPNDDDEVVLGSLYERSLRGFVDGSLGLEYRYTKRISAFFDINNLTGGRYPRFFGYPVQSVMAMGGLTYSF